MPDYPLTSDQAPANYSLTLASGGVQRIYCVGQFFRCKELYIDVTGVGSEDIDIQLDGGPRLPINVGCEYRVADRSQFSIVTVENPTSETIYAEFIGGFGQFVDDRLNIVRVRPESVQLNADADTIYVRRTETSVANNTTINLASTPVPTGAWKRKSVQVSNLDATNRIHFCEAGAGAGELGTAIFPETTIEEQCSGDIGLRNESGSSVSVSIGELWYKTLI